MERLLDFCTDDPGEQREEQMSLLIFYNRLSCMEISKLPVTAATMEILCD